jgi:hypothetical protein
MKNYLPQVSLDMVRAYNVALAGNYNVTHFVRDVVKDNPGLKAAYGAILEFPDSCGNSAHGASACDACVDVATGQLQGFAIALYLVNEANCVNAAKPASAEVIDPLQLAKLPKIGAETMKKLRNDIQRYANPQSLNGFITGMAMYLSTDNRLLAEYIAHTTMVINAMYGEGIANAYKYEMFLLLSVVMDQIKADNVARSTKGESSGNHDSSSNQEVLRSRAERPAGHDGGNASARG